jgi:outer membrane protein assembly factor BamA
VILEDGATTCDSKQRAHPSWVSAAVAIVRAFLICIFIMLVPTPTHAEAAAVERVELLGLRRTRPATVLDLLPRVPPAPFRDDELHEIERRLKNLAIFDQVEVTRIGSVVRIAVREKWTLVPRFELATGTTLQDSYLLLGLTDYNFLGLGGAFGVSAYHEQRGFGFSALYQEHVYRHRRWAMAGETSYGSSQLRFRGDHSWFVTDLLAYLWTTSPRLGSNHARLEIGI